MKIKFATVLLLVSLLVCTPGLVADVTDVQAIGNNIERVSVSDNGTQGDNISDFSGISADGRYVAFESWSSSLVSNDTNNNWDIFIRDRKLNTTILISVSDNGIQGNSGSMAPSISDDGRYITFASTSNNLVYNDQNKTKDIFIRDRQTNTTTLISVSDNGTQGNGGSYSPRISGDGRYVAFISNASSLVPDDPNGQDVFIRDRHMSTTTLISVSDNGTQANDGCYWPDISDDGRYVAFLSYADNLVPDDTNGQGDVFIRDRQSNTTTRVNVASDNTQANLSTSNPSISDDGRYVAFFSFASNLVPNDTNEQPDVFVRDLQLNITTRVSVASTGTQNYNASSDPSISGNGRYVAFESYDSNLVPGDANGYQDIFVHDCQTGATACVSVSDNDTQSNGDSLYPIINDDGHFITFFSDASNLVPNDTNGLRDVFAVDNPLYELPPAHPPPESNTYTNEEYCFSLQYPGDWVESPEFVTTPLHLAAFRVPYFVPGVIISALDANIPMSEDWILQSFEDLKYGDPAVLSPLVETTLADGTKATTYKIRYIYPSGYEAVAFCLDADRCDKRIRVQVYTIDAFSPYDENQFSDIAHTLTFTCTCGEPPDGSMERVSVSDNGTQGNGSSYYPSTSADGRFVAFCSDASNLVPNDTNKLTDVFVRDLQANTTTRVSVASDGTQGNGVSYNPSISDDGQYIAFDSGASNFVLNDTNEQNDVFVRDRQTNTTTLVSVSDDDMQGNGYSSDASISGDGRYVAFGSYASNLVPNDTNGRGDVFVRDLQVNLTSRISVASNSAEGNSISSRPSISSDGRYVAFMSDASNLVPNDNNGRFDIFVHNQQTGITALISVSDNGTQGNWDSYEPSISGDGRYVAFNSSANTLVPDDTNGCDDVFVRDLQTNTTVRVSVSDNGTQGNNKSGTLGTERSDRPSISGDGRYVTFNSLASNLVDNDTDGRRDIFTRDLQTNTTTTVSIASDGFEGSGEGPLSSISGDGQYVAFTSAASNLVSDDTNAVSDVFVADNHLYEYLPTSAPVASATGTGTINFSISNGGIQYLTAVSQDDLPCTSLPGNVSFSHGFISFAITDITPGSTVTITITFPSPIPEGVQYWKCQNGTWIDCTSLVGDDDGDEILTLSITDGGPGDGDGQINGQISDPSGPAMPVSAPVSAPVLAPVSAPRASPKPTRPLNPAQMSTQYVSINPQQAQVNQPLIITVNVVNSGDQAGNYNLVLKINGQAEQTRMVSVGPQGTQPVKFTIAKSQPGTYAVDIGGQRSSFTILGASPNTTSNSRSGVIAILIIGTLILTTIVVLLITRRPA